MNATCLALAMCELVVARSPLWLAKCFDYADRDDVKSRQNMKGRVATPVEVKARWAYSELTSHRFGRNYVGRGPQRLHDMAASGQPFSNLQIEDWPELVVMLVAGRNPQFVGQVDSSPSYVCEGWDQNRLLSARALSLFNPGGNRLPISYRDFYAGQPLVAADGQPDASDPRAAIASIVIPQEYSQDEPVIVIDDGDHYLLLEGYLRSLLFMRSLDRTAELLVWVPQAANAAS